MNCTNCKAEWTPPTGVSISKCPFCGNPLYELKDSVKNAEPHEILLKIVQQYDKKKLGDTLMKGMLTDLMPHVEKKIKRIFKQALDDRIGSKLLDLEHEENSIRIVKTSTLKDSFKNNNGFDHTADYVFDCFLFALGWIENIKTDQQIQSEADHISLNDTEWTESHISWLDASKVHTILDASNLLQNNPGKYGYISMDHYSTIFTKHLYLNFGTARIIDGLMFSYEFPNCLQGKSSTYPGSIANTCKVNLYYKNDGNEWKSAHNSPNLDICKANQGRISCDVYSTLFPKIIATEMKIEMIGNYWLGGSHEYFRINNFKFKINSNGSNQRNEIANKDSSQREIDSSSNTPENKKSYKCKSCGFVREYHGVPSYCPSCKTKNGYWTDLKSMQIMSDSHVISDMQCKIEDFIYKHSGK
jgi:hypothetical protein